MFYADSKGNTQSKTVRADNLFYLEIAWELYSAGQSIGLNIKAINI